jgi:hypothetical protein
VPSRNKRSSKRTIAIDSTAEAYLELLHDRGIEYFFGNGGATSPRLSRHLPSRQRREAIPQNP